MQQRRHSLRTMLCELLACALCLWLLAALPQHRRFAALHTRRSAAQHTHRAAEADRSRGAQLVLRACRSRGGHCHTSQSRGVPSQRQLPRVHAMGCTTTPCKVGGCVSKQLDKHVGVIARRNHRGGAIFSAATRGLTGLGCSSMMTFLEWLGAGRLRRGSRLRALETRPLFAGTGELRILKQGLRHEATICHQNQRVVR
jgi:hypothetical protein